MPELTILGPGDQHVLDDVAEGVFDRPIDPDAAAEFLADPRHRLAVATAQGTVVGMASAVCYVHPDKPRELWINEVGVADSHRRRGIGRSLLDALLEEGRSLGCVEAWVLTERSNGPAMALYASTGGVEGPRDTVMVSFDLRAEPDGVR